MNYHTYLKDQDAKMKMKHVQTWAAMGERMKCINVKMEGRAKSVKLFFFGFNYQRESVEALKNTSNHVEFLFHIAQIVYCSLSNFAFSQETTPMYQMISCSQTILKFVIGSIDCRFC